MSLSPSKPSTESLMGTVLVKVSLVSCSSASSVQPRRSRLRKRASCARGFHEASGVSRRGDVGQLYNLLQLHHHHLRSQRRRRMRRQCDWQLAGKLHILRPSVRSCRGRGNEACTTDAEGTSSPSPDCLQGLEGGARASKLAR